jgi:formamidopyrimidine-DNA glycosylase
LRGALAGRTLTAAHRRGKTMWCETSGVGRSATPGPDLGIHLGMGGRILVVSPDGETAEGGEPRRRGEQPLERSADGVPGAKAGLAAAAEPPHRGDPGGRPPGPARWNRFTLEFADGGRLVLFDKRRLGRVWLNPDIDALGPDACDVTLAGFRQLIMAGTVAVKARLLDQSKLAGIGNLLADEMLWQARVPPAARTSRLRPEDADRLYRAMRSALGSAIAHGGVHTGEVIPARRVGGRCPRCGAEMKHGTVGGRSTWWCAREQGRRVAGQRLSETAAARPAVR